MVENDTPENHLQDPHRSHRAPVWREMFRVRLPAYSAGITPHEIGQSSEGSGLHLVRVSPQVRLCTMCVCSYFPEGTVLYDAVFVYQR